MLAYPAAAIEPFTDSTRDEGESRLGLLQELLTSASDEAKEECHELCSALFSSHGTRPRICLCCVRSVRCAPEAVQEVVGDEAASDVKRVAIRGSGSVAVFSPAISLRTRQTSFLALELAGKSVRISRVGGHGVCIQGLGPIDVEVEFDRSKAGTLSRLFEPPITYSLESSLLPKKPEHISPDLMSKVADFWTRIVRAHILVDICTPKNSEFPLTFDRMHVSLVSSAPAEKRATLSLSAILHSASTACACRMHGLEEAKEDETSEVHLTLSMCGRSRAVSSDDPYGNCSIHSAFKQPHAFPTICCAWPRASVSCIHRSTESNKKRVALCLPTINLNKVDTMHAQHLLHAAKECYNQLKDVGDGGSLDQVGDICRGVSKELNSALCRLEKQRQSSEKSATRMAELDKLAVDALKAGDLFVQTRKSTGAEELAQTINGKIAVLTKKTKNYSLELSETHMGFFKRLRTK